jgi:CrcB protein
MLKNFLIVGLGGFTGSILRYACYLIPIKTESFWVTMLINIIGSFAIGIIAGLSQRGNILGEEWRIFLGVGICGGFTTFSTFSMEMTQLLQQGKWINFTLYLCASIVAGLLAFIAGQKCI